MVTARAASSAECEIFFFLFLGYRAQGFSSSGCSPSQLFPLMPHRRYPASCAKEPVRFSDGLFCTLKVARNTRKYDLVPVWSAFCLFFRKGQFQSLLPLGFVFRRTLW